MTLLQILQKLLKPTLFLGFLYWFCYYFRKSRRFQASIIAALVAIGCAFLGPDIKSANGMSEAEAFPNPSLPSRSRSAPNRKLFGSASASNSGSGSPSQPGDDGGDGSWGPEIPVTEDIGITKTRVDDMHQNLQSMKEASKKEASKQAAARKKAAKEAAAKKKAAKEAAARKKAAKEAAAKEAAAKNNVGESYKDDTSLDSFTQSVEQDHRASKEVAEIKQKLENGEHPSKIGYHSSYIGGDCYYIRKSLTRTIVHVDRETNASDIVGIALRSRKKEMRQFGNQINQEYGTRINPKSY